jgi:hypothetical protein
MKETMKLFGYLSLVVSIAASPAFAQTAFTIPVSAISSGDLSGSSSWIWSHDAGTPGSSVGSSQFPVTSPSLDGLAREFYMSYSGAGGERFSLTFGNDTESTHFVYDTYVYIDDPSQLANLELDMNQVMANGKTVIYAFQCSGYSKTWEYNTLKGTSPVWHTTGLPCNPQSWAANTWHHVQIASHRSSSGEVTYDWVNLDGTYNEIHGAKGNGAIDLHWAPGALNLNFQLDGAGEASSSVTIYADELTIYRW